MDNNFFVILHGILFVSELQSLCVECYMTAQLLLGKAKQVHGSHEK